MVFLYRYLILYHQMVFMSQKKEIFSSGPFNQNLRFLNSRNSIFNFFNTQNTMLPGLPYKLANKVGAP